MMNPDEARREDAAADRLHALRGMRPGSFAMYGKFRVGRMASDFVLTASDNKERARFGNLKEIASDLAYSLANDRLPEPTSGRW